VLTLIQRPNCQRFEGVAGQGIYTLWPELGRAPSVEELAKSLDLTPDSIRLALEELNGHFVNGIELEKDSHNIRFAWPFSSRDHGIKVTLEGGKAGGTFDFFIAGIKAAGGMQTTFGTSGLVTTDFSTGDDEGKGIVERPSDDFLLVAGFANISSIDFAFAQYDDDGALDTTCNTDGKANIDVSGGADKAFDIDLQSNEKPILVGDNGSDFAIARLIK